MIKVTGRVGLNMKYREGKADQTVAFYLHSTVQIVGVVRWKARAGKHPCLPMRCGTAD